MIVVQHVAKRFRASARVGPTAAQELAPARGKSVARPRTVWAALRGVSAGSGTDPHRTYVDAVRDVSFVAADGCITGLLGPNGAGKTTTLRMVAGLFAPDGGKAWVDSIDVAADAGAARGRLGVLSDARGLYPRLTARENIVYYAALHGLSRDAAQARAEHLADTLDLRPLLDRRTEGFSQGERMKTALARALVHDPANIILDEPTNGLDVVATRALRETLRWLRSPAGGAKCIVFSTHIMQEVERLCDVVHIVSDGRTVASGSVRELLERTGEGEFEEAFVRLAYPMAEKRVSHTIPVAGSSVSPHGDADA